MSKVDSLYPWPRPRQQTPGRGTLKLAGPLDLCVADRPAWLAAAAGQVERLLKARAARALGGTGRPLRLTVTDMDGLPAAARAVRRAEGYVLIIAPAGIHLAGTDAAGVFYGAHTLGQLLEAHAGAIPCATIRDWPAYPIRGMQAFLPGRGQMDFFERLLDTMAELRFNTLILEIGAGMEFRRHPRINRAWERLCRQALNYDPRRDRHRASQRKAHPAEWPRGAKAMQISRFFPKDSIHPDVADGGWLTRRQVEQVARECARRHIRVIPEVQSLSHCYWLCCAYPQIAERADDPWPDTYCPNHPRTYELLFDAMDEILEVFQPAMVNIGHDELLHLGHCPRCRGTSGHKLLADDVRRIHGHLAARGIGTMMWGDKLMKLPFGGEAREKIEPDTGRVWRCPATWKAIDMIPKDIVILDWFWGYTQEADENSVDTGFGSARGVSQRYFEEHGFKKVYGNWVDLEFSDWKGRSDPATCLGAEVSTWCEMTAEAFGHNRVVADIFPAAQTLWAGRSMPKRRSCELLAQWHPSAIDRLRDQPRWMVSPDDRPVVPLALGAAAGPLPAGLAGKLRTGSRMTTVLGAGSFALPADRAGRLTAAVVLSKADPTAAALRIGRKCRRLLLLHGTTMRDVYLAMTFASTHRGPAELIRYRVRYRDGRTATFTANYGQHIAAMDGYWPYPYINWIYATAFLAVPAPFGRDRKLYVQEWVNPRPATPIETLEISLGPDATDNGWVIVPAVSAVI